MEPHQLRVMDERRELDEKRAKLQEFLKGELFKTLDPAEQFRLQTQCSVMCLYSNILTARIEAFK